MWKVQLRQKLCNMWRPLFHKGMEESQEEFPSEQPGRKRAKHCREESTPDAALDQKEYDSAIQSLREELELNKRSHKKNLKSKEMFSFATTCLDHR